MRVLTFSFGFGPKLLTLTRWGTEFAVSAIPLGGYIKPAGGRWADGTPEVPRPDDLSPRAASHER